MNFQTTVFMPPIRVLVVNPLMPASQLLITKMLSGIIFGRHQLINLILLVYANEVNEANELAQDLTNCAFPCYNMVTVTSDLPVITDADIFCFMTSLANPNSIDFDNMDSNEQFDTFYLIIKLAQSLGKTEPVIEKTGKSSNIKKETEEKKERHPIIVGDGLIVIEVLSIIAKTLPPKIFYCATPLRSIAKTILSDYIRVQCNQLNDAYIWAANDLVFHAEFKKPFLKDDKIKESTCDWDAIATETLEKLNLEHIQFNESWMKREFIQKMVDASSNNPYGCISKSAEMSKTLRKIWQPYQIEDATDSYTSLGVISDGSLGTIKGLPYVLPLIISEYTWTADVLFEQSSHVRHEIKRINTTVKAHHEKMVPYCKNFLQENVIMKAFVPTRSESSSVYSDDISDEDNTL